MRRTHAIIHDIHIFMLLCLIRCCHLKNEAGILLEMAIIAIKCAKYQDNFGMAALKNENTFDINGNNRI